MLMFMKEIELNKKRTNNNLLIEYGFIKKDNIYYYEKDIMDDEFKVYIELKDNHLFSKIIDKEFEEEYLMSNMDITGNFIGRLKMEYDSVVKDILDKCFLKEEYREKETKIVIDYVKEKYGSTLEYLWEKYPSFGVIRNNDSKKWYGLLGVIPKCKLTGDSEELIEVLNLKNKDVSKLINNKNIFPAYHMNKKSWISIILDGKNDINNIKRLIDDSYLLSNKK